MTEPVRGFPAFAASRRRPRRFASSWWGNAWLQAMADTSLDAEPLTRGRAYAYAGRVGSITVSPGRIAATVLGDDGTPYQAVVHVDRLSDAEWARLLDEVASKAGHIAALLDKDVPHDLVTDAANADVRLLPGIGDLEPRCTCEDWEHPCRHAAALCYQVAWLLDTDPFVLLLIRGRGERELTDELRRRTAPGVDPEALELLVTEAAARAGELLAGTGHGTLDVWADTVRLAATHPELTGRLQRVSGRSAGDLERAVRAWSYGGPAAFDVLERDWEPSAPESARARTALAEAWRDLTDEPPEPMLAANRWTDSGRGVQLRYGRDGRWYPYRLSSGTWWPAGWPDRDPGTVLAELLG